MSMSNGFKALLIRGRSGCRYSRISHCLRLYLKTYVERPVSLPAIDFRIWVIDADQIFAGRLSKALRGAEGAPL